MNPQSVDPKDQKPGDAKPIIFLVALVMFFVVSMVRLLNPQPTDVAAVQKPAVEEANTVNNRTAYEVARGGSNTVLFKAEIGNDVIYFSNQGGVWGHSKP
jgi:hypothetical protein